MLNKAKLSFDGKLVMPEYNFGTKSEKSLWRVNKLRVLLIKWHWAIGMKNDGFGEAEDFTEECKHDLSMGKSVEKHLFKDKKLKNMSARNNV